MHQLLRSLGLLLAAAGIIRVAHAAEPPDVKALWDRTPATMSVEGDALRFYGEITRADVEPLRRLLEQAPATLSRVEVASPGGEALAAIAIAGMIHDRGLEVVVVAPGCHSACANYLFTPARHRTISPGSLVLWHQSCPQAIPTDPFRFRKILLERYGTSQLNFRRNDAHGKPVTDPQRLRELFEAHLDDLVAKGVQYTRDRQAGHQRIYAGTGIDDRIICLTDHIELPAGDYSYTLPVDEMARFGLCDINAPADYVEQAEVLVRRMQEGSRAHGVVRLSDHPEFRFRYGPTHCAYPTSAVDQANTVQERHAPSTEAVSP